jgi:hypothetical protein
MAHLEKALSQCLAWSVVDSKPGRMLINQALKLYWDDGLYELDMNQMIKGK